MSLTIIVGTLLKCPLIKRFKGWSVSCVYEILNDKNINADEFNNCACMTWSPSMTGVQVKNCVQMIQ